MKILWFANTPSLYKIQEKGYNGGGWISSLENLLSKEEEIELAICFYDSETKKVSKEGVIYYPLNTKSNYINKIKYHFFYNKYLQQEIKYLLKVVDDFKPDLIHIFGSENPFGLISNYVKVPVIVHLQGIISSCVNVFYSSGINKFSYFFNIKVTDWYDAYLTLRFFSRSQIQERNIFSLCQNYMGRTEWDNNIVKIFSPDSHYYHCSEILRDIFYTSPSWETGKERQKIILLSTISHTIYKGFDLILKTAKLLEEQFKADFIWNICGIEEYPLFEKILNIKAEEVNIKFKGVVNAEELVNLMYEADIFIHPSYIDNSPNSVCEAQLLGMPVISTNVGGISSLIEDKITGILSPANDPYTLASEIVNLKNNPEKATRLGKEARRTALERHNPEKIVQRNLEIYKSLIKE